MHNLDLFTETANTRTVDDVVVNITITDSRGFVHHYGDIHTTTASARAAITALSQKQPTGTQ